MFLKNTTRPAYAAAGVGSRTQSDTRQKEAFQFENNNTETDDFNSFNSGNTGMNNRSEQRRSSAQRGDSPAKGRPWLIPAIIGAVVVVVLLLIVVVAVAANVSHDMKSKGNTYISYADTDGVYHIAVNGNVLDQTFEGETTVIPSLDTSFAYIVVNGAEGYQVYFLRGKKLEAATAAESVSEVYAYAQQAPGIIYQYNDSVYLYTEEMGEEKITRDLTTKNYMISADASSVIYTEPDKDNTGNFYLWLYREASAQKLQRNVYPVGLSTNGDYVYFYGTSSEDMVTKKLYVRDVKKEENYFICNNFTAISAMNIAGDELIYLSSNGSDVISTLYRIKKDIDSDHESGNQIAKGVYVPVSIDPQVVCLKSFTDMYVQGVSNLEGDTESNLLGGSSTYYINKKGETQKIANAIGKFSPDEKYFYYVNSEDKLLQVDLKDKNLSSTRITEAVIDFAVTEKGNVYYLTEDGQLRFYKVSTKKKSRVSDDADTISMHIYSNVLYFTETDGANVFMSSEGSLKETTKFGSIAVTGIPHFINPESKKTFVYFFDQDTGLKVFYTSGGKSFKLIANDCGEIAGVDEYYE